MRRRLVPSTNIAEIERWRLANLTDGYKPPVGCTTATVEEETDLPRAEPSRPVEHEIVQQRATFGRRARTHAIRFLFAAHGVP